ncbi:MAG: hypothetical protein KatS3mg124_0648 [Porticoccaceae bacterium]|nr:MAG: hypothetical protein KatS3mg124_0648 [Porticoccaceae bacterium]
MNLADPVRIADHFAPDPGSDPYWTESAWFSWAIPEEGNQRLFLLPLPPQPELYVGRPAMWDARGAPPSGQLPWNFLFYDWQLMRPLPAGRYGVDYDKYRFATAWGMAVEVLEPLRRYRLRYAADELALELLFTATAELNWVGPPPGGERSFRMHFEQPGRIQGRVSLGERTYEVDCFAIRDGSHGPRSLEQTVPGGYTWSTADEGHGFHLLAKDFDSSRETRIVGGYLLRDGVMAPLAGGVRRVVERVGPRPERVEVEAEDCLGRRLYARGRAIAPAEFMLFPDRGQWWSQFAWDYDGFAGALGEDQEYYGIHDFRRWHRAGPDAWRRR